MEQPLNLAFIISSLGGPKLFSSIFTKNLRSDVVYILHQRMPSREFMKALVDCLKEELPLPIHFVEEEETALLPGEVYFLSNAHRYEFSGSLVKGHLLTEGIESPYLDPLLTQLASTQHHIGIALLSGVLIDRDGVLGLQQLKKHGVKIVATRRELAPVSQMIEELSEAGLISEELSPANLLQSIPFPEKILSPDELHDTSCVNAALRWLVVDDDAQVREVIGDILEWEKIACDFAKDGLDAVRKIQKTHYGALLLDIKMPEMDGIQTLGALRTIDPHIPTLIVTGFDDKETRRTAQLYPNVLGILLKPFMSEDLRQYMPQLLARQNQQTA